MMRALLSFVLLLALCTVRPGRLFAIPTLARPPAQPRAYVVAEAEDDLRSDVEKLRKSLQAKRSNLARMEADATWAKPDAEKTRDVEGNSDGGPWKGWNVWSKGPKPSPPTGTPGPAKLEFRPPARYFYGKVRISMYPDAEVTEEVLSPVYKDGTSSLAAVQLEAPVGGSFSWGFGLTQSPEYRGKHFVGFVTPGSVAEKAGIREGDVLRALTCYALEEETKNVDLFVWRAELTYEKDKKTRAYMIADGMDTLTVQSALVTNTEDGETPGVVNLVFERKLA